MMEGQMDGEKNVVRDLQGEIKNLEGSRNIKILGIETLDGILTRPVVETAIDSLQDTLDQINLDEIAASVNKDIKEFAGSV
jgi:hypothetical protein